ncbi:MAG TPA: sigma 54-interacting transcriptional regulator [Myxococcales bacterium]|nr:sigma 54-interacting transcriptional regulator [Myxococcales bacterium]
MSLTPVIPRGTRSLGPCIPWLFEVLDCAAPQRPPRAHPLAGVSEVLLGRGEDVGRDGSTLRIGVPDRWMSESHARLRRLGDQWQLEDLGTTNGTRIGGQRAEKRELADGDALEMGGTFFLFRAALPSGTFRPPQCVPGVHLAHIHPDLATMSRALAEDFGRLPAIARSAVPVVLAGETGTGKEVVARAVHQLSGRAGRFVAVNCAAIAPTLLASELFGHRKGAFSGALENRPGLVRAADCGTLLLDEVAELSPEAQGALLRFLQEGEIRAVGATDAARVDVRVIAASHVDLEEAVAAGTFRADLLARLSGFTLCLPPLRGRREDLGLLVAALLRRHGGARATLTAGAGRALMRYRWPLNVRELEQCLAAALALAGGHAIEPLHMPLAVVRPPPPVQAFAGLQPRPLAPEDAARREELVALLRDHRGNVAAVARALGKARMQVHRWVKRFQLTLADYR